MKNFFIALILTICSSCGVTDNEVIDTEEKKLDYFPLSVGNEWHYKSQSQIDSDYIMTWSVNQTKVISDKKYYEIIKGDNIENSYRDTSYFRISHSKLIELVLSDNNSAKNVETTFVDFSINKDEGFTYLHFNVTLNEKSDTSFTFFYDSPMWVDEEQSITFEKNKGITLFYSYASGSGQSLFDFNVINR